MVPAWPDCVVNAEEHQHVLPIKYMSMSVRFEKYLLRTDVHNLHCPQRENIFLVKEDPGFLRMLDPLHSVNIGHWPLVRDLRGVHTLDRNIC